MAVNNYLKTYASLVKGLSEKTVGVFNRRFGINQAKRETLESIGQFMGITRERVRQIEKAGFIYIKANKKEILEKIFAEFTEYFKNNGGLKREDLVLEELGGKAGQSYVLFLLNLGNEFSKVFEKKDFHSFWTTEKDGEQSTPKTLVSLISDIKKYNGPVDKNEFLTGISPKYSLQPKAVLAFVEISKNIKENKEGKIGLTEWPEINPRGIRDKSFLVFKKEQKPLHFTDVAKLIDSHNYNLPNKKTLPQTVHNELIKDERFILVGRGIYALREWDYATGTVKEVIVKVLKDNGQPLQKEQIVEKVLAQHIVAKSTVLMNLNDKNLFSKDEQGKYILRKTEIA